MVTLRRRVEQHLTRRWHAGAQQRGHRGRYARQHNREHLPPPLSHSRHTQPLHSVVPHGRSTRVEQHLAQPLLVADDKLGQAGHFSLDTDILVVGVDLDNLDGREDDLFQVEDLQDEGKGEGEGEGEGAGAGEGEGEGEGEG